MKYDIETIRREGYKYIIPGRKKYWDELCDAHKDIEEIHVALLNQVLEIMKSLSATTVSYDSIHNAANEEIAHSQNSWTWVVSKVACCHERGVDFAINGSQLALDDEDKKSLGETYVKNQMMLNQNKR